MVRWERRGEGAARAARAAVVALALGVVLGGAGCSCTADRDDSLGVPDLCVAVKGSSSCEEDGTALDWGTPPVGMVSELTLTVTNRNAGSAALVIDAVRVTDALGFGRLFDATLCLPSCDVTVLGFPATLFPGQTAELVLTFDATDRDGLVPAEALEIVSSARRDDVAPAGVYVRPFEGVIDGCVPGRVDANGELEDGCECAPSEDETEFCDGLDNDCDGMIDEGAPGSGIACVTGLPGECGPGTLFCEVGEWSCVPDVAVTAEVCDGLDNDCDGAVDEENSWEPFNEGLSGGNMGTVAFDPRAPGVAYATTGSRVYRSDDGGATFALIGESVRPITALGFPPNAPDVILASAVGAVIRSEDEGVSWEEVALSGFALTTIMVHPVDPAHVYVGTNGGGIFKSTNGGSSFSAVNQGVPYAQVSSLVGDASDLNRVVASLQLYTQQTSFSGEGVILRTDNGGANWLTAASGIGRVLRLSACGSDTDVIYGASYFTGVVQSLDGGESWETAGLDGLRATGVGVAPSDCLAIYAATELDGTFVSDDGGESFAGPTVNGLDTQRPGDVRFAVHPSTPATALLANHSGIFRTTNLGSSWTRVDGIEGAIVRRLAVSPAAPDTVWAATWGQGPWVRTGVGGQWDRVSVTVLPRDWAFTVAPDPGDAERVSIGAWGDLWASANGGGSFALRPGPTNVFDVAFHPSDANVIFAGTQVGGIWKSADGGASFEEANAGLPAPWDTGACVCQDVRAVHIDAATPDTVYAATNGFGVWKSVNAGGSWALADATLGAESVSCLEQKRGVLFACVAGKGIWSSEDGGASFTKLTPNLAELNNVTSLLVDELSGDLYASSDNGVYRSTDEGATWDGMDNTCLPPSGVGQPVILEDGTERLLLVGTGGIGVYKLRLD